MKLGILWAGIWQGHRGNSLSAPPCLGPQLGRLKGWGDIMVEAVLSAGSFTRASSVWAGSSQCLGLLTGPPPHDLSVWLGFLTLEW